MTCFIISVILFVVLIIYNVCRDYKKKEKAEYEAYRHHLEEREKRRKEEEWQEKLRIEKEEKRKRQEEEQRQNNFVRNKIMNVRKQNI